MTQPNAKVICHSAAPNGDELITMEIELHRFVLPEFNTHRCLTSDTELWFDLPKDGARRLYKMSIGEFYDKWYNGAAEHIVGSKVNIEQSSYSEDVIYSAKELSNITNYSVSAIRLAARKGILKTINPTKNRSEDFLILGKDFTNWRNNVSKRKFSLKNKLKSMKIRMLNEDNNLIENTTIRDIWEVGEKEVFTIKAGAFHISGTKDHPILTTDGWKELGEITEDTFIITCGFGVLDKSKDTKHKKIKGKWTAVWNRQNKDIVYSRQEGLCDYCGEELEDVFDIHHIKPVHSHPECAFDINNVVAVHKDCHKILHKKQGWQISNKLLGVPVQVDSIERRGVEKVYDLSVESNFHNFIANGIVVHNCMSRNFQSSRAVPVEKMIAQVRDNPALPVHWGKNQRGMVAESECDNFVNLDFLLEEYDTLGINIGLGRESAWRKAASVAADIAEEFNKAGYHKQLVNRLLEPFMWTKGVVTSTREGFESFFKLRSHKDAQPEIKALSDAMRDALNESIPNNLSYGDYHLPYACEKDLWDFEHEYMNAIKVSVSCCAQVSYRNLDDSLDKAIKIYDMLNLPEGGIYKDDPPHFSPTEHVAKVYQVGVYMSGNFNSDEFYQYRKALELGIEESF